MFAATAFTSQLDADGAGLMNLLWQLYVERFSLRGVPEHVTSLVHTHLNQAPWHTFRPSLADLQRFNKVRSRHVMCNQVVYYSTMALIKVLVDVRDVSVVVVVLQVLDTNEGVCAEFVCSVTCAVNWAEMLTQYTNMDAGFETSAIYHAQLFHLLVRLGAHSVLLQVRGLQLGGQSALVQVRGPLVLLGAHSVLLQVRDLLAIWSAQCC